jgi:hypothetical protein
MGQLTPGATYIYESPDGGQTIYARESGTNERKLVGETHKSKLNQIRDNELWREIRVMAETHEGLREELERVKTYFYLLKENNPVQWHPV